MKRAALLVFIITSMQCVNTGTAEAHYSRKRCDQYEWLLRGNGLPVETFKRIMFRESGCLPHARNVNRNGTVDRGLLQLNSIHLKPGGVAWGYSRAQLFIPRINIKIAAKLYKRSGMKPWRVN